ncbi:ATP-binding protein [Kitasatospora viridis]|uniref:Regulatory LuxR family protein n=1 Tax=Kitasatospora viridis TaxID=281105 RepID=A0A561TW97_9ACTN|nr:LuxR family transcriptional regulator [Kitasatospora viridis]TWF91385.1 regulatory LuxR family protein [Kitasatospora viridis]
MARGPGTARELPSTQGLVFAGRGRELRALLGALGLRPAVVLVEGEAGIGKSRLVAEAALVLRAQGVRVILGGCHPLREPLPYGPVIDALRAVGPWLPPVDRISRSVGVLAPLLPDLADRLPAPPAEEVAPGALRHRITQGVRDLLIVISPAVLVVEDLHWADDATLELLLLLSKDLAPDAALVLTYRGEELPERRPVLGAAYRRPPGTRGTELSLGPLVEEDLRKMAHAVLGDQATADLTRTLHARSGGLPLVIEEDLITLAGRASRSVHGSVHGSVRGLGSGPGGVERRSLARQAGDLGVPRSLRESMTERIGRLAPAAAAVANAAAVLAVDAGEDLLGAVAGLDEDACGLALTEALAGAVLRETSPGRYGFAHVLARQAVYDTMPGPLRTRGHRRALEVLRAQPAPPLVQIAHHTRALGDTEDWLRQAEAAADQATAVGDLGTAALLLGEILEVPRLPAGKLGQVALAVARIARLSAEPADTVATLRRILATPGLPGAARGEIRYRLGAVLANQLGDACGWAEIEAAVPDLQQYQPSLAVRAMSAFATCGSARYSAAEQRVWLQRARDVAAQGDDESARAVVHSNYTSVMAVWGDPAVPELLARLVRESADPDVVRAAAIALSNAAEAAVCVGLDERSVPFADESLAISARLHQSSLAAYTESYRLLLDWACGRWHDFDTDLAAYHARYPESPLTGTGLLGTVRGLIAAARGRAARAAEHFDRCFTPGALDVTALGAAAGLARLHLARDDADTAWQILTEPLEFVGLKDAWPYAWDLLPTAVETAQLRGDRTTAERLTEQHAAGIRACEAPGAVAEQYLCRGLLLREDDPGAARGEFERARAQWLAIGRPHHAALAAERAALTEPDGATEQLAQAIAVFDGLGATRDADRCHRHLRERGRRPTSPRGRAGYGAELSPRERQVADLLAEGASNRDMAAALFLSPRTVEHHVANVLRKLGTSRADLAASSEP